MTELRLGVDCDGVLADFTTGYLAKLALVSGKGRLLAEGEEPSCWYWPREVGYTHAHEDAAWKEIKTDPEFWLRLRPLIETPSALIALAGIAGMGHHVYFITNRPGIATQVQTVLWLLKHGYPMPQVIVAERKGPLADGLELTHFLDDKAENCYDVRRARAQTQVFLMKRRYNQDPDHLAQTDHVGGITTVSTIKEFLLALEGAIIHAVS